MRFITWCVGWLVLALWAYIASVLQPPHIWPLFLANVLWLLLGVALGLVSLVKLFTGKLGAGGRGLLPRPLGQPPAPQQKPKEGA